MLRKVLRVIAKIGLVLILLPVAVYIALVVGNLWDEKPLPEIPQLASLDAGNKVAPSENGYFAWVGIAAPLDSNQQEWGQKWFNQVLLSDKARAMTTQPIPFSMEDEYRKLSTKTADWPCYGKTLPVCLERVGANPSAARSILEKESVTLARYDIAVALPNYQEPFRPDLSMASVIPRFSLVSERTALAETRIALAAIDGNHDAALDYTEREIAFQIRQLRGSQTLLEYLLAAGMLRSHYQLLDQWMSRYPDEARKRMTRLKTALAPLPKDALSLERPLLNEFRATKRYVFLAKSEGFGFGDEDIGFLLRPLFLPSATVNIVQPMMAQWIAIEQMTDDQYRQEIGRTSKAVAELWAPSFTLRNLAMKLYLANLYLIDLDYKNYFKKRDNLAAYQSLLAFKVGLLERNIADRGVIDAELRAAGRSLIHPFAGTMPAWDSNKKTLGYLDPEVQGSPTAFVVSIKL